MPAATLTPQATERGRGARSPGFADEALGFLAALADERVAPAAALERLADLRAAHPEVRLDLVWDTERFGGAVHYDLLVRDGVRTTSLSVTPVVDAVPWPLRGSHRVGDTVLLEVDGERLEIGEAVQFLDTLGEDLGVGIADRLVVACLVRAEVAARVAGLDEAEAEAAEAAYRRRLGLEDDDALDLWCRVRQLPRRGFRSTALAHLALARLRRDGVDGVGLQEWLAQRRRNARITWFWSVGADVEAGAR